MMKRILYTILMLLVPLSLPAGQAVSLKSPDRKIAISFSTDREGLTYSLRYGGQLLVENSRLAITMDSAVLGAGARLGKARKLSGVEEYSLPVGKCSHVSSPYREVRIPVLTGCEGYEMEIQARAFDDAVAFRHIVRRTGGRTSLKIRNETFEISPAGNPTATALFMPGFINSHEGVYTRTGLDALDEDRLIDMPMLLEFAGGPYVAVTEANLVDYAGMYLIKEGGKLTSRLSPRLDDPAYSVLLDSVCITPWRVFLVSDRVGALIESTALTSLASPCAIEDTSWLKPGKTTFPWWNDTEVPDTTFQPGNNFLTNKYYIDFAADNGLEYHSVYGYADMPWYYDNGPGFGLAGPDADLTRPAPTLDFKAVCDYAKSRGVDIHVWLNWAALYKDIDRVFTKFNEWGVKGMMVDFMNRDDQEMIKIQETILRKAAEHKLFIQFHGASKPSGLWRTYPNEFTREGTLNYEVYKWDAARDMGADHDLTMPFTRLLAGPADYHLGGFRSVPYDEYKVRYSRPNVTSTRCHMLAMYVVLESYLNMVCDYPEAYLGQPGFEFLRQVPTTWDETRVLDAEVTGHIVTARRKGAEWYIGGIAGSKGKSLEVPLSFLGEGRYVAEIYTDTDRAASEPNSLDRKVLSVGSGDVIPVRMAESGGFVMRIVPEQ
jgi:alpha-glucosidase